LRYLRGDRVIYFPERRDDVAVMVGAGRGMVEEMNKACEDGPSLG
jgi:hypothetical protein